MFTSRREFLRAGAIAVGAANVKASTRETGPSPATAGVPLIHVTDLFHPHGDPDDHFDLAVAYALTLRRAVELSGVVIDFPPSFRPGDPAVVAVAQMNRLTGQCVPVSIGTSLRLKSRRDALAGAVAQETAAARFICGILRSAEHPVGLVCVGNAADIVVAALREPELFRAKCSGVYLNSGSAHDNPDRPRELEFNVNLDPAAYAAMFDLPCPLFWFPCWHTTERRESGADGSFYWLPHAEALAGVSAGLANYFAFMFDTSTDPKWLRAMTTMPRCETWARILRDKRGMWSTASQFVAAGLRVTKTGEIVAAKDAGGEAVFTVTPVTATCAEDGRTTWRRTDMPTGRWMLSVTDPAAYPAAMTRAVAALFKVFV